MPTPRVLLVALLAACSFQPGTLPGSATADAAPSDNGDGDGDSDDDLVLNAADNCVTVANTDQRNFDGDKHGDACDGCPHIMSDPDPDADGDGVGDACDPRPALGGDARAIWIAFYDGIDINGWTNTGGTGAWTVQNHKLVQSNTVFSLLDSPLQYFDLHFETRLDITSVANEVGFCSGDVPIGIQYYCCGLFVNGIQQVRAVSGWPLQLQTADPKPFTAAVGDVVDIVGTMTSTQSKCAFIKGNTTVESATARGPRALGTAVFFATVPARYHYAFVVTIGGT